MNGSLRYDLQKTNLEYCMILQGVHSRFVDFVKNTSPFFILIWFY